MEIKIDLQSEIADSIVAGVLKEQYTQILDDIKKVEEQQEGIGIHSWEYGEELAYLNKLKEHFSVVGEYFIGSEFTKE